MSLRQIHSILASIRLGYFFPYIYDIHPSYLFLMIGPLVILRGIDGDNRMA